MTGDTIDTSLESLPRHDVDPRVADRILRRALTVLHEERERMAHPWRGRIAHVWDLLEPAFSSVVVGAYLFWMIRTLVTVMR